MNYIVIEDEPLARAEMETLILEVSDLELSGSFSNVPAAQLYLKDHKVDLIFLDIEMPLISGIEFAENLPKETLVIFTTSYPQYALKSYELDAIDYLLKPIIKTRLAKAIEKAKLYHQLLANDQQKNVIASSTSEFILIKADRKFHKVMYADIKFIEGLKDYVVLHTTCQKLITAMNLKTIHLKIPESIFHRVGKSYVVNVNHIASFDHHTIYLGEDEIPLGEVYKESFFERFGVNLRN
ncbi:MULTISPECIES: LytR/AlgR family response regulator transcription factor [Sphingobacterium]|jgi:DNA-binding LytR/AlgR family response regulator|uniref:LytR/AlgR family response regulator transcription factor n=1 Tax=Sphingobacterium TaxID=28453 RepID=UPI0004E5F38F|nr:MULTISPECIES: LytTR family DNA-binding domain-containing protein [Sphingobacterium]UPZ38749.1 LytTR family DNA-binding domain-containing protein [Sphingobacterium sp. PCS056]WGQ13737.1 LytTR family DNA-binding domain-containing protein [Sphingobacterium faecium]CDS92258.1 Response regulator of the LytR/AlgR family [Sphingobacterium sp. PM2-P1-29]